MSEQIKYWGYIHENGSLIMKRYFSTLDLSEALKSPFVKEVFSPVGADDIQHARKIIIKKYKLFKTPKL